MTEKSCITSKLLLNIVFSSSGNQTCMISAFLVSLVEILLTLLALILRNIKQFSQIMQIEGNVTEVIRG